MKYVHLPTEVEAVQWHGVYEDLPHAWRASGAFSVDASGTLHVVTAKGPADVEVGDFIVRSGWGEYWPIGEPVFLSNYRAKS